jgi:hypothetical protein
MLLACGGAGRPANTVPTSSGTDGSGPTSSPTDEGATGEEPVLFAVELEAEDPMPGGQFVLVENPSDASIDLGCWRLRVDEAEQAAVIPPSFPLPAGATARLFATLPNVGRIELVDRSGRVIDGTPMLSDTAHDDRLWFRTSRRWRFGRLDDPLQDVMDTTLQPPTAAAC